MVKNAYKYDNQGIQPENDRPDSVSIDSLWIEERVKSKIPVDKTKYDKPEKIDELYRTWSKTDNKTEDDNYQKILLLFYDLYKPRIRSIAKHYRNLSPIFDEDDLLQTGLLGLFQALLKYDHSKSVNMKFSTYLEWSIRNVFQRAIGNDDKLVEIFDANNQFECVMKYHDFLVKKKDMVSRGFSYVIKSRQCYISDEYPETESQAFVPCEKSDDFDAMTAQEDEYDR